MRQFGERGKRVEFTREREFAIVQRDMRRPFTPKLDILPPSQASVWRAFGAEIPRSFTLYGGTALALQLGHRQSIDFDFFGGGFDPDDLLRTIPLLSNAEIVQRAPNTLTVRLDRNGPVLISFFGVPELGRVEPTLISIDTNVRVASLLDIAGMKASVVQKRAAAKDYVDIAALIAAEITLDAALAAASAIYGPTFNAQITLKALAYFNDVEPLPDDVKRTLQEAVRKVNLTRLPTFQATGKIGTEP